MKVFNRMVSAVFALGIFAGATAADTNPQAVSDMLDRIGGNGTSTKFVTVVDEALATNGKETFVITSAEGKPCIKGSTLSALTTGIGWYLNHHANVNLTWNCPHVDLSKVDLPLPAGEEKHSSSAVYRYYLNFCTYSYSMSTWTWDRWQEEIDWMALHGVNMPLHIIGVEEVWRKFLMEDYGYTKDEVNNYVAGPCFMAWFCMNNLEGWGGKNPDWWYERQAQLGKKIGNRMRSLGIEPVLPGFCQLPTNFTEKTGVLAAGQGNWCGFQRPFMANPDDPKFDEVAAKYYKRLKEVLGESKYYSLDPFHEGGGGSLTADKVYSRYYEAMNASNPGSQWVIQSWQWSGTQRQSLNYVPVGKLIVLDLFSEGRPAWDSYGNHDVVYSTIFNFGGRTGYFGRVQKVIDEYWNAKTQKSTVKGIGAAPEAIEQTPVAYDVLFELPWYDSKPDAQQWFVDYSTRRYGQENATAAEAWELIRTSALNHSKNNDQGPHEALMCARPNLEGKKASTWGYNELYYDPNMLIEAAYKLLDAGLDGPNYSFDLTDISRQALTDYARKLLPAIAAANSSGNTQLFNTRRDAFLQLILDIDELLNTNAEFMLGHWTERARKMADEVEGTTLADRDWLELNNARTIISTWGARGQSEGGGLHDYSYRQWGGFMKDYYYARWKTWFDSGMKAPDWFNWEWNWAHSNPGAYPTEPVGDSHEVAARLLPKYLSPFVSANSNVKTYYVPRLIETDATKNFSDQATRGVAYVPNLTIDGTSITEIAIDFNKSTLFEENETAVNSLSLMIPEDAPIGERKCRITLADGTVFIFTISIFEEINDPRTVSVKTSDAKKGSVSIDGTDALSVTNKDVVSILATPTQKYDFAYWTDADGNNVGNDNPMKYYGKEAAEFTAHFVDNKWGVPGFSEQSFPPSDGNLEKVGQYLIELGVTQNGESNIFFHDESVPTEHFYYVTNRIKAAPGGEFSFYYTPKGTLQHQYLSAYCDLNADGEFDITSDELLGTKGTHKAQDQSVNSGTFRVLLPYTTPKGTTHIRLRFDGAWMDSEVPGSWNEEYKAFLPKANTNRMIYEILLEVNDEVEYSSTVTVKSNAENLGTVRSENASNIYNSGEKVILTAFPVAGSRLSHWEDSYGRKLPTEWMSDNMIEFTAFDNAEITAVFEKIPAEIDLWKFAWETDDEGDSYLSELIEAGEPDLDLSAQHSDYGSEISYISPEVFAGNTVLRSLVLPDQPLYKKGDVIYLTDPIMGQTSPGTGTSSNQPVTTIKDADGKDCTQANTPLKYTEPFVMKINGYNNGRTYNQYGSVLFANGTDGLANNFSNGWSQFYLKENGTLDVMWDSGTAVNFPVTIYGKFQIVVEYLGNKQTRITVTNEAGEKSIKTLANSSDMKAIWRFVTDMPEGMWVQVRFSKPDEEVIPGELLAGCRNLMDIHVSSDCEYAVEKKGVIYDKTGKNCIAYPEGRILGGAFSLVVPGSTNELSAAPVSNNGEMSNLTVSTVPGSEKWNTLWTIDNDGSLIHYNSGLGVDTNGRALSKDDAKFSYSLAYDEGDPSIAFTDAAGKYMTASGLSADRYIFDFYPVYSLNAPAGNLRTVTFPVNVVVPDDTEVFALERATAKGGYLRHIMAGHIIPAGTGVLIKGDAQPFEITSQASFESPDQLDGTTVDLVLSTPYYVLEGENFVRKTSGTVPANTGYVPAGLNEMASFPYQIPGYEPIEIDGWKFDWRYSYDESVVCLTAAVESGNGDLDLSKKTEGDESVIDIDPAMFVGHTELVEVTLPASRLGQHYYDTSLEGAGTNNALLKLPQPVTGNTPWNLTLECYTDGSTFNQWGSGLFATGTNSLGTSYPGGFQLYLSNAGKIVVKHAGNGGGATESSFDNVTVSGDFAVTFNYSADKNAGNYVTTITVVCNGKKQSKTYNAKLNPINSFCASIPKGVNINKLHLEGEDFLFPYTEGDLFKGCTALQDIHVAAGSDFAVEKDGVLYDKENPEKCIAFPEGRLYARPFMMTCKDGVHVAADPVFDGEQMTETDVIVQNQINALNALWYIAPDNCLNHLNSGIHMNAVGSGITDVHSTYSYTVVYGEGEPSLNFSLGEDRHLSHDEGVLFVSDEPHPFRFAHLTSLDAPVVEGAPSVITFPMAVIVPEDAVVKGVAAVDRFTGATLFNINPGTVVPAGYAMIVVGGEHTFEIAPATAAVALEDAQPNVLLGTTHARLMSEPYYMLEGDKFVRHESGTVHANSAYIPAEDLDTDDFPYDDSIVGLLPAAVGSDRADETFDLMGRRVNGTLRNGVYIKGGHKILIK